MEDQIKVGDVGEVDLKVEASGADAGFKGSQNLFGGFLKLNYSVDAELDVVGALQAIKVKLEAGASPLLKPVEEFTFNELISYFQALK